MKYKEHIIKDISEIMTDLEVQPILFVGSGISQRYFKTPNWQELMKILVDKCPLLQEKRFAFYEQKYKVNQITDYTVMASSFVEHYCEWAWSVSEEDDSIFPEELFGNNIEKQEYIKHVVSSYFKEVTDSIDLDRNSMKEEIELLKEINPHAVITTNYDGALELIFPEHEKVVGQKIIRANYTSYGEILKIHGCCEERSSIVLTSEDYDQFNEKKKYLSSKLLTYFAEHPLFFLGYSLSDKNIINILSDIDEILASKGELVPNIYIVIFENEFSEEDDYPKEKLIQLNDNKSIRIKVIYAKDYSWVYKAISQLSPNITVNPKLLRSLLSRTYKMVTSDIPRRELPFNFEILNQVSDDESKLPTLFGIGTLDNGQHINASFPYTITQVAERIGYKHWVSVKKIIDKIYDEKGVDIKASNNRYHLEIITGGKSKTHKYSEEACQLFVKVDNEEDYELNMS